MSERQELMEEKIFRRNWRILAEWRKGWECEPAGSVSVLLCADSRWPVVLPLLCRLLPCSLPCRLLPWELTLPCSARRFNSPRLPPENRNRKWRFTLQCGGWDSGLSPEAVFKMRLSWQKLFHKQKQPFLAGKNLLWCTNFFEEEQLVVFWLYEHFRFQKTLHFSTKSAQI